MWCFCCRWAGEEHLLLIRLALKVFCFIFHEYRQLLPYMTHKGALFFVAEALCSVLIHVYDWLPAGLLKPMIQLFGTNQFYTPAGWLTLPLHRCLKGRIHIWQENLSSTLLWEAGHPAVLGLCSFCHFLHVYHTYTALLYINTFSYKSCCWCNQIQSIPPVVRRTEGHVLILISTAGTAVPQVEQLSTI